MMTTTTASEDEEQPTDDRDDERRRTGGASSNPKNSRRPAQGALLLWRTTKFETGLNGVPDDSPKKSLRRSTRAALEDYDGLASVALGPDDDCSAVQPAVGLVVTLLGEILKS
ncbi:unnamed protein product [Heligmosomoides polygyrus]|uniref:Uncharacterized protein n=1 Tax=Heligmosomoides polygyrus TaxID=6339 RepID=A0A183FEE0_HELPZ|nr:unnamed protein product [Heligmosomoides polygyrus]